MRVWERGPHLVLEALDDGIVLSAAGPDGRTTELAAWERGARLELTTEGW